MALPAPSVSRCETIPTLGLHRGGGLVLGDGQARSHGAFLFPPRTTLGLGSTWRVSQKEQQQPGARSVHDLTSQGFLQSLLRIGETDWDLQRTAGHPREGSLAPPNLLGPFCWQTGRRSAIWGEDRCPGLVSEGIERGCPAGAEIVTTSRTPRTSISGERMGKL